MSVNDTSKGNIHNFFTGAYVPLTMEGNIVVDNVLASCYPTVDHDLAHIAMTPIRWLPSIAEWMFGEESGYSIFITMTEDLGKFILPSQQMTSGYY